MKDSICTGVKGNEAGGYLRQVHTRLCGSSGDHSPKQFNGVSERHQQERMEQSDGEKTGGLCEHIAFEKVNRWSQRNQSINICRSL